MPNFLNLALSVLAILIAVILITAWLISSQMVRRRKPDPPASPADYDLNYEHITFGARDGVELGGWLVGEARSRRPTVIFCAGINGSKEGDVAYLPMFAAAGFDVLQFDWRAHGISDGLRVTMGVREIDDVLGAVDFLQARGVTRIGLMGFSMGGAVALRAAAQDARIACVVCDGGFVHVAHAIEAGLREKIGVGARCIVPLLLWMIKLRLGGIDLREADPIREVGRISPRPILFIHGARDAYVPIRDQDAILAAASDPKTLWRVEGAGHREAYRIAPDAYREKVIAFFKAYMR